MNDLSFLRHVDRVDPLLVACRAEGDGHERLGLAAREQGGTVRARQPPTSQLIGRTVSKVAPIHPARPR